MKKVKLFAVVIMSAGLLLGTSSCFIAVSKDNGQHKGWYKNPNNPHNPNTTNPGKAKGKGKGK